MSGTRESEPLSVERRGRVAWLTLERPQRRNALSRDLIAELAAALVDLTDDEAVTAIAITGSGGAAFCSGLDLKEHAERDRDGTRYERPMSGVGRNLFELLVEIPKPTMAVLNGPAVGAGFELALACDLRIAAEHARLELPEARRGMGAHFASVLLPRLLPRALALELLYTGAPLEPRRALELGLLNRVVSGAALDDCAEELLAAVTANAPLTVARYKHVAVKSWELPVHTALRLDVGPDPYTSADRVEGTRAFVEQRAPRWSGS